MKIASLYGSHASDTRAVSLSSSEKIYIKNSSFESISSQVGAAYGIDMLFETCHIVLDNVTIKDICATTNATINECDVEFPKKSAQENDAAFIAIGERVEKILLHDVKYEGKLCGLTDSNVIKSKRYSQSL